MAIEVEKLNVSLTASTSEYRQNMEDAMSVTDRLVERIKIAMRSLNQVAGKIGFNVDTTEAKQSLDDLARKLDETHAKIVAKTQEIENAKKAMSGTFGHFGIDSAAAQPGLQYISQLQKEYDELYQQANKYSDAMERMSKGSATQDDKAGMSALSTEMDKLIEKLTVFNQKLTDSKTSMKELVTDAREIAKAFGAAANAATLISKARVNTAATAQAKSLEATAKTAKYEPVKQKHVSMIDRARKAMDKLTRSSKKASGSFHGESFFKKIRNFTKSMIIFRGIFYVMSKLGEAMQAAAQSSEKTRIALDRSKSASTNLVNSFAVILLPVLKAIAPVLESISRKIVDMANVIAHFMAALFGQDTYQKAIYASETWGDTTADAVKKVAKAQKSIMGFDELNVLQKPDSGDSGTTTPPLAGGGLSEEVAVTNKMLESTKGIRQFFSDIKTKVEEIAAVYMEKIHPHIEKLKKPLEDLAAILGDSILQALDWIGEFLDNGGADGLETLIDTLTDLVSFASKTKTKLDELSKWFESKGVTLGFSAKGVGEKFQKLVDALHDIVDGMNDLIDGDYENGIRDILDGISSLFSFDLIPGFVEDMANADGPIEALNGLFKNALENPTQAFHPAFATLISNIFAVKLAGEGLIAYFEWAWTRMQRDIENVKKFFSDLANSIKTKFNEAKTFVVNKITEIKNNVSNKLNEIKNKVSEVVGSIKGFFTGLPTWFSNKFQEVKNEASIKFDGIRLKASNIVSGIKGFFTGLPDWFSGKFADARNLVSSKFDQIKDKASITWTRIKDTFSGVGSWFSLKFTGAKNKIVEAFDGLSTALKKPFNSAIDLLNRFIDKINRVNINIPGILGGGRVSFAIPRIVPLATGTVVQPNNPFLAALGDNKREPEIVSPLSTMKSAFKEAYLEANNSGGSGNQNLSVAVYIGEDKIVERVIKGANLRSLQSGKYVLNT